ncbi:MATE family efflux transporter [Candidatus Sumerlaeota bacterium]|nr:MATE family efflux transporter [Candidatus Sumerlaeota bacterium]
MEPADNIKRRGASGARQALRERWNAASGYREVLTLAWPLVISTGSISVQHFVDRMFLNWHSTDEFTAAFPAGILSFSVISFFLGTGGYVNTFVSQYFGAKRYDRIGVSLWQSIYFSIFSGLAMLAFIPFAGILFERIGHDAQLVKLETEYFRIALLGGGFVVANGALSGFFTGVNKPMIPLYCNVASTAANVLLTWIFVFGKFGAPELGLKGAAWATVSSVIFQTCLYAALTATRHYREKYSTLRTWRLDTALLIRLLRFGLPSGVQFTLDISSFALFIALIGRLGRLELASTNMAMQINMLAFLPMVGFGIATSTLVGRGLGANRPDLADKATWSALHMTFSYMAAISVAYVLVPLLFILPFRPADPEEILHFEQIKPLAIILLRYVAVYSLFDTLNIIFSSALKGAGDTRFVMNTSLVCGWLLLVTPTYCVIHFEIGGLYMVWLFLALNVVTLGFCFFLRFIRGPWRGMRVIEQEN